MNFDTMKFERVHPFIDGNGRTGRLVINLVLVRLGYPPVVIFKRQRAAYLTAMQRADSGDYGALGELIARAMYDNLNRFIVPNVAGSARMVRTSPSGASCGARGQAVHPCGAPSGSAARATRRGTGS